MFKKIPHTYAIVFYIIIFAAILTWIIPSGEYDRQVIEVDGHDFVQLGQAFDQAKMIRGQPSVIIAHTIKGRGVSFMENNPDFHGKAPDADEIKKALKELG